MYFARLTTAQLCGTTVVTTVHVFRIQYRAALKYVYNYYKSSYVDLLERANMPFLFIQRQRVLLMAFFKICNKHGLSYLHDLFLPDGWMNQAYSRLSTTHGHITDWKLLVCMYWIRIVLVRPAASLYSASPLKHHPTGKQWCPNQTIILTPSRPDGL